MSPLSLRSILLYASSLASRYPFHSFPFLSSIGTRPSSTTAAIHYDPLSGAPPCPLDGPMSCHNNAPITGDSCCFVSPGGRILLTQFWDEKVHAGGTEEDWTAHGLWPDLCDGTYDTYCHMTPQFSNITAVLEHYDQQELLEFMDRYWIAASGPNSHLWAHEYNKHGTCINTLSPACYGSSYASGIEVVDYFTRAAALFRTLDTYTALAQADIVPHPSRHYPLVDVRAALERFSGGKVVLRCNSRNVLHEAWYVYFVKGSLQTGEFVPAQQLGRERNADNCAPWVRYLPKRPRRDEVEGGEL